MYTVNALATSLTRALTLGSDSTSISVTFAIFFLLTHPEYYDRLRKELDEAFPDPTCSLSLNVLASLVFLDCVINESLRLGPSPYYYPRIVPPSGGLVDGKYIPEGTTIALASYSQHISPENFSPSPLVSASASKWRRSPAHVWSCRNSSRTDGSPTDLVPKPGRIRRCSPPSHTVRLGISSPPLECLTYAL